jgi:uncharacterized protein (DUF58 family)
VAAELAALLAVSAVSHGDRVGMLGFTDRVETFLPPAKGTRHVLRLLREVLAFEPTAPGTNLTVALDFLHRVLRRRAVVFLISDFLDVGFENAFRRTARRHDLTAARITEARELDWPAIGLVQLEDAETGKQFLIDTRDAQFRAAFAQRVALRRQEFRRMAQAAHVDIIDTDTRGHHAEALVKFFQIRERRWRRG